MRLSTLLLRRYVLTQPRRWLYYTLFMVVLRRARRLLGQEPEIVYRAVLRRGQRLDLLTAKPLPSRYQGRKWRRRLAASSRAELRSLR